MGPSGSLIKGCGCTETWAWSLACRVVPFPRVVAILLGVNFPPSTQTQHNPPWLKGHIYSRNNAEEHTQDSNSIFPARTTLLPYEPWWASMSTQNTSKYHTDSLTWPSQHQASFLASVHDKSQQSATSGVPAVSTSPVMVKQGLGGPEPSLPQTQKNVCSGVISAYMRSVCVLPHKHPPSNLESETSATQSQSCPWDGQAMQPVLSSNGLILSGLEETTQLIHSDHWAQHLMTVLVLTQTGRPSPTKNPPKQLENNHVLNAQMLPWPQVCTKRNPNIYLKYICVFTYIKYVRIYQH